MRNRLDITLSVEVKVDYLHNTISSLSCIYKFTFLLPSSMLYLQINLVSMNCP